MNKVTLSDKIKSSVSEVPVEQEFLDSLKRVVVLENKPRPRSPYFKPSSLNCARLMYFDCIQAQQDNKDEDYSGIRICETGSNSHENLQRYCSELKKYNTNFEYYDVERYVKEHKLDYLEIKDKIGYEVKLFDTRYNISFLCDGILKYDTGNGIIKWYIVEFKTESDRTGVYRDQVNPKHILQSVSYSLSLQISDIIWLYEERNYCVPKVFHTYVTQEQRNNLVELFNYVNQCVVNKVPPQKVSDTDCNYCCYKKVCSKI